ncbi:hypothetical protein VISI1226_10852 [Vibrio sinaloensis DSM 21326]|uniref:DUF3429 domain-containing protein n=1 Tax=Vibrio sinaloensis DSM 21326 TaxID=945550 RepID=E8MAZ2_PHOS4|nr:DUF3429 domain-containing protein [Vibrio sinaloensis]EGA68822.1 hypothetical protein VISI1226_10852 [Vibrio sinaloensis DSM 21326]
MNNDKDSVSIMLRLGYLGLIPFVFSLICIFTGISVRGLTGVEMFVSYSVVILSFLSGVIWGNGIDHSIDKISRNALLLSNLFAVMTWAVLLLARENTALALLLLAIGYGLVWFSERAIRVAEKERKPAGYKALRARLTSGVVIMHCIALIA